MNKPINFSREHPLFKKPNERTYEGTGVYFEDSIYFLWWEFLRRNKEYKKCCETGGKGQLNDLYKDFGDVFNVNFKTWWTKDNHGTYLFGNPLKPEFKIITEKKEIISSDEVMYLQIPMKWPKIKIQKKFKSFLEDNHQGIQGVNTKLVETSRYTPNPYYQIEPLKKYLRLIDYKKDNPDLTLFEIGLELGINSNGPYGTTTEIKGNITRQTSNMLKLCQNIIDGTSLGKFPVTKKCDVRNT
jgi:hypothetical protein